MILEPLTDAELEAAVLPWAVVQHAELVHKYEAAPAHTKRRLLGRFTEMRWAEDRAWRREATMLVLHESALVLVYDFHGAMLRVSGRYAPKPWQWTFAELAQLMESYEHAADARRAVATLHDAKTNLDLFHVTGPAPRPPLTATEVLSDLRALGTLPTLPRPRVEVSTQTMLFGVANDG